MTDSFFQAIEKQKGVSFEEAGNAKRYELQKNAIPTNYTMDEFKQDPDVIVGFDKVKDYLAENRGVADALIDSGATLGEQDDVVEFLRDDVARIGAPAAKAMVLKDAPEDVKEAYRLLQSRFEAAEVKGFGQQLDRVVDYGTDMIFNPEVITTVASLVASPFSGGSSFVAQQATKKAAQAAARQKLKSVLAASGATIKNNPKKFAAAMGAYYGGADSLAKQSMDVSLDKQDEISYGTAAATAAIGAPLGVAGYGLFNGAGKIARKYFQKSTDPDAPVPNEKAVDLFDSALEGELIPKSAGQLVSQAFRISGPTTEIKNVGANLDKLAKKFSKEVGGGEQTKTEILSRIRALADSNVTDDVARNELKQYLYETAANLTGNFLGKHAGILSPHLKVSGTARELQEKLAYEFGIKGRQKDQKIVAQDLSEVQREVTGKFNEKFRAIVDDLNLADKNGNLAEQINDALMISLRSNRPVKHDALDNITNEAINKAAMGVKDLYNEMGVKLKDIGVIDDLVDNYVPRMWDRKAIEDNQSGFIDLLVSKGGMNRGAAKRTVDSMLDIKNQIDTGGGGGHFFSSKRKLNDIAEDADFQEFLNSDVLGSLHAYTFQAGKSLAKHRVLGVNNVQQFKKFWTNRIKSEVQKAGGKFTKKHEDQITSLYQHATGEGLERYGRTGQNIADAYGLGTRIAYLGLATISSLTEVMLNLSRGGFVNSVKGLGEAMSISHKHITGDLQKKLMKDHNLTAAEALSEMRKFSINVNQGLSQIGNRLAGDDLVNEKMQDVSNKFFRGNMLDQWTKFVQTVSFSTGKRLIHENLEALSHYKGGKLDERGKVLVDELKELGIDYRQGVNWLKQGAKTNTKFYNEAYLRGAARYTDALILQPTAMSGLKPKLHSNPKSAILFQLLGYPVAFTNTVMKQTGKRLAKAPLRNGYKVIPAAIMMTGMARWTNYLRTGGKSEEGKEDSEIIMDAITRWGGNGILLDSIQRASENAKYTKSNVPYLTMPFGPAGSDALSLIQQGLIPTVANKVPVMSGSYFGNQILGEAQVKDFKAKSKNLQKEVFGSLIPKFDSEITPMGYAVGGLVGKAASKGSQLLSDMYSNIPARVQDSNELKEVVSKATDGMFDSKFLNREVAKIDNNLAELEAEGVLNLSDLDDVDFVNALIVNEVRKTNKPLAELEKIPEWKKAMESKSPEELETNFGKAQDAMGISKSHKESIQTISQLKQLVDPDGELQYIVSDLVRGIRNKYQKYSVDAIPVKKQKSKPVKLNKTLLNTQDFVSNIIRTGYHGENLSERGASKLAADVISRLAAEKEINFSKFVAPKLKPETTDLTVLPEAKRKKALTRFIKDSAEQNPVFRGVTSMQQAEYNVSFAFPREVGTHVGTEGAATVVLIRGLPNNLVKQEFKEMIDTGSLTRKEAADRFSDSRILDRDMPEINEFTTVTDDIPNDMSGYFGKDIDVDAYGEPLVKPLTMQKGYINVKNPLFIDTDLAGWEAERILTGGDWDEHFMKAIKVQGKKLTPKQLEKVDELTVRSQEFEKYFDSGNVMPANILDAQRDNLKRAEINIDFRNLLNDIGFDSIMYKNEVEMGLKGESEYSYILFKPQQFKVITSKGFDPDDLREGFFLGGLVNRIKKKVPLNIRQLAADITGDENTITEHDLSKEELAALTKTVKTARSKKKDVIEYEDYETHDKSKKNAQYVDIGAGGSTKDFVKKLSDPAYSMKTTLGQAQITMDKEGNTIIKDRYNFNDAEGDFKLTRFLKGMKNAGLSPYKQMRNIAKEFGSPEGSGAEVEINLGKINEKELALAKQEFDKVI